MAKSPASPGGMVPDLTKLGEVRGRLLFLLGAIIVFRIGSFIPVPGIDPQQLEQLFSGQKGTILDMFNMFSGGALHRLSVFALGVMPYISASIIVQLLAAVVPQLKELKKEGESGRRQLTKYTRYGTLALALFQALSAAYALQKSGVAINPGFGFIFTATVSLVTGTMFLMWLGEQITERGIGNGMSMIIFAGIVAGLPPAMGATAQLISEGSLNPALLLVLLLLVAGVTLGVVFVERAQRRIPVHHARRQQGRKLFAAQTQHLPLKLNMAGVIPPIFASSIILFPATIMQFFGGEQTGGFMQQLSNALSPGQALYTLLYAALIIFFCFFYTALMFDSRETAENLKKSGAFIPGIRPGKPTADYLNLILTRITLAGALFLAVIAILPSIAQGLTGVGTLTLGGTGILIVVAVVLETSKQVESLLLMHNYEGFLKR